MTSPNERPDAPPVPPGEAGPGADLKATLESGARALDERAQALGREAESAARRWSENPAVAETADLAGRLWGLVLLGFGLWFFANITLDMDLPSLRWGELWPVVLIVIGGFIVVRGLARRR
ncbi:MAG: hypothetical protein AB1736_01210 [Chloroflexota bacterium]